MLRVMEIMGQVLLWYIVTTTLFNCLQQVSAGTVMVGWDQKEGYRFASTFLVSVQLAQSIYKKVNPLVFVFVAAAGGHQKGIVGQFLMQGYQ